jgi:diguanylate cyclase (GGDEF)-like protein
MKIKDIYRNHYKIRIWWIIALFIVIISISFFYVNFLRDLIYKNTYDNISELSKQTTNQLNNSIDTQKQFVQQMVDFINKGYAKTPEEVFKRFNDDLDTYHFTRLVILDRNGNGSTSDGFVVENYENMEEFFNQKEVYLSENRPSTVSNNQVNIYSKTFSFHDEELVLFATINTENYKDILTRRLFNGQGGTYLINNTGVILIDSFNIVTENNVNLYDFMKEQNGFIDSHDSEEIDIMANNIRNNVNGTFDAKFDSNTYFIHYEKLAENDWYVVTVAPASIIARELNLFLGISLGLCFLITFIVIGTFIYIDISNQKQNRKLYKVAYIDPITSLGNEVLFKEKGALYLQSPSDNKYIVSIDIDKFKALNNIYGYDLCNKILNSLGEKLVNTFPKDNITCRISADIFVSMFSYSGKIDNLIDKLLRQSSKVKIDDSDISINLSIGIYQVTNNDKDINKVLDKAYMARAKTKGLYDVNYYIYDDLLENNLLEEQQIESSMHDALKNEEFKIVYQPKTFTNSEKLAGAEALVRWYKNGEIIPPSKFIPLFEKNKFIIKLDLYIFEHVCKDMASWKEKYNFVPTVSINVSKEHFVEENFIDKYVEITDKYNVDRSKIDLEITESATIDENIDTLKILNNIKAKGFLISIDDFGTGYSSLSMIQSMPFDILKIDKVFVDQANLDSNQNIINYIMLIAEHLGVETIVEGVETKEQVDLIRKINCDIIQGYYYSKPLPKEEFENYFNAN